MLVILLFVGATLCRAEAGPWPTSLSNALPAIGVGLAGPLPRFDLQIPDTGPEAAEEHGVRLGFGPMKQLLDRGINNEVDALGLCASIAWVPIGMGAGALYGLGAGESGGKVDSASAVLNKAIIETQAEQAPGGELLRLIHQKSAVPMVVCSNRFPAETAFRIPSLMDTIAPLPFSPAALQQKEERGNLNDEGLGHLVLIRVINHGLSGPDGHNSSLTLSIAVRVTLVRVRDYTQVFGFYTQYESTGRKFVDWAVNNAQAFRAEMTQALHTLAESIVGKLGSKLPSDLPPPVNIVQANTK